MLATEWDVAMLTWSVTNEQAKPDNWPIETAPPPDRRQASPTT